MSGHMRHGWAKAAVYASALVAPLVLSGCQSTAQSGAQSNPAGGAPSTAAASGGASPSGGSSAGAPAAGSSGAGSGTTTSAAAPALNATGGTRLTVDEGTSKVLMDGKEVDFGTSVHYLAWSPDGKKAAFIDGSGNLDVANADGSGEVTVAKNPGGQIWSHPTWQVTGTNPEGMAPRDFIFFGSSANGGTLEVVSGTAHGATPQVLPVTNAGAGENVTPNPATGNYWPNGGGAVGSAVYEHDGSGVTQVYIRDDYLRQQGRKLFDNASQPAYFDTSVPGASAPGQAGVVFVRVVNGHKHVFLSVEGDQDTWKQVDLTPTATSDCTAPAVSPDGKTVAFDTPSGVETVSASGGTPTRITDVSGFPSFR